MSKPKKSQQSRLRPLSLAPLGPDDALRGAMQVPPPDEKPKKRKAKRKKKAAP